MNIYVSIYTIALMKYSLRINLFTNIILIFMNMFSGVLNIVLGGNPTHSTLCRLFYSLHTWRQYGDDM